MIEETGNNAVQSYISRRKFLKNAGWVLGGASLASLALLNGWKTWGILAKMLPFKTKGPTGYVRPRPPARTGDISVGTRVDAISQSLDSSGGYVSVSKGGDPLDGFTIYVPPKSYPGSRKIKMSYAPITSQTFGADITPVSPMIYIDNGGGYSDEMMYVRVPVKVPDGYFAMGFIYDEQTKQLEGMPLAAVDADSVTLATRHFCDMFLSMIKKALLPETIETGFLPGFDDWQFVNRGSYVARGHCEGQCLTEMWYYCTHPDGIDAYLHGRYDNNGDQPATPDFWQDDSLGYRLCSTVHKDVIPSVSHFWENVAGKNLVFVYNILIGDKWVMEDVPLGISDEIAWNLFAYGMRATGEPQLVGVWNAESVSGHALVCYAINQGNLYVADPNYPGSLDRIIEYADGKFKPYHSGVNREAIEAGQGIAFEKTMYIAKSTVVPWDKMAQRWGEFKQKTIGAGVFPDYKLEYTDEDGKSIEVTDGMKTPYEAICISSSFGGMYPDVYRDGVMVRDQVGNVGLYPGNNKLGVNVIGLVGSTMKYIDFKYVNIIYEAAETATATKTQSTHDYPVIQSFTGPTEVSQLTPGATVTFSVKITGGTPPYHETWYANMQQIFDGAKMETVNVPVDRLRYNGDSWTIYLMVKDANGEPAQWLDSSSVAHPEFVYGVTRAGQVITEPTFPYRAFGAK